MTYLLGKASVEEFETWKSAFHRFDSFRTDHGQEGWQAFRSVDDPTEVVVLFEWADDEDPRAFFASEEMRERMAEAGVKGRPEWTELEFVDRKAPRRPTT